jgi:hypothetical protein
VSFSEVLVVLCLPDAPGIGAISHVASYPDHVWGTVLAMSEEGAVIVQPSGDAGVDKAPAFCKGRSRVFVVCSADVNGVLECTAISSLRRDDEEDTHVE